MVIRLAIILALISLCGCGRSGQGSTHVNSSKFKTVQEKADFLNQYVTFRSAYESLDFDIKRQDKRDATTSEPQELDVRVVAVVPAAEIQAWIPTGVEQSPENSEWVQTVPTSLDTSGIHEWYREQNRIVGVDREHGIVAYRSWND